MLVDGELVLYVERGGKTLLSWTEDEHAAQGGGHGALRAVSAGALGRMTVQKADGAACTSPPAVGGAAGRRLRRDPAGLRLRG